MRNAPIGNSWQRSSSVSRITIRDAEIDVEISVRVLVVDPELRLGSREKISLIWISSEFLRLGERSCSWPIEVVHPRFVPVTRKKNTW